MREYCLIGGSFFLGGLILTIAATWSDLQPAHSAPLHYRSNPGVTAISDAVRIENGGADSSGYYAQRLCDTWAHRELLLVESGYNDTPAIGYDGRRC